MLIQLAEAQKIKNMKKGIVMIQMNTMKGMIIGKRNIMTLKSTITIITMRLKRSDIAITVAIKNTAYRRNLVSHKWYSCGSLETYLCTLIDQFKED